MTKYKIGDKFKVVGNSKSNKYGEHCFEIGSIIGFTGYRLKQDNSGLSKKYGIFQQEDNSGCNITQTVKFKDLEYQYKIGDKVRIVENNSGTRFNIGDVVEVVKAENQYSLGVNNKDGGRFNVICNHEIELMD